MTKNKKCFKTVKSRWYMNTKSQVHAFKYQVTKMCQIKPINRFR